MALRVKCLPRKCEDQSLVLRTHILKKRKERQQAIWAWWCTPVIARVEGGGNKQIPGTLWPASLAKSGSSGLHETQGVLKISWGLIKE